MKSWLLSLLIFFGLPSVPLGQYGPSRDAQDVRHSGVWNVTGYGGGDLGQWLNSAAAAASVYGGGTLYTPAGFYTLSTPVKITASNLILQFDPGVSVTQSASISFVGASYIKVQGNGSQWTEVPNATFTALSNTGADGTGAQFMWQWTNASHVEVSGLVVDGNRSGQTSGATCRSAFGLYGVNDFQIHHSVFQNVPRWPVFITSNGATTPASGFSTNVAVGPSNSFLNSGTNTQNAQCSVSGGDGGGVGIQNGTNNPGAYWYWVFDNFFSGNFMPIDLLPQGGIGLSYVTAARNKITGSTGINEGPASNIFVENSPDTHRFVTVDANQIACQSGTQSGIYASSGTDLAITNNHVSGCADGIKLDAFNANLARSKIRGNTVKNSHGSGIIVDSQGPSTNTDVLIAENECYDDQGTKTQPYGLQFTTTGGSPVLTVQLGSNRFNGNLNGPTLSNIAGTSPTFRIDGVLQDFTGTAQLSGGTVTVTFPLPFSSASSYWVQANDQTAANAVRIGTQTATQVTLLGTGTDFVTWRAGGY